MLSQCFYTTTQFLIFMPDNIEGITQEEFERYRTLRDLIDEKKQLIEYGGPLGIMVPGVVGLANILNYALKEEPLYLGIGVFLAGLTAAMIYDYRTERKKYQQLKSELKNVEQNLEQKISPSDKKKLQPS